MTFESWLKKQKDRDDHIGDLANDFIRASKTGEKEKCDEHHLLKHQACREAHEALAEARKEFSLVQQRKTHES